MPLRHLGLLLLPCLLLAGETDVPAQALWPLPLPAWMREQVVPAGLPYTGILTGQPASLGRLQLSDRCLGIGELAPCSDREVILAVRLAALQADNRGVILRNDQKLAIRLPAFMAWGRWGVYVANPALPPPLGLAPRRSEAWRALPIRVQACALRAAAGAAPPWLEALIDLAARTPGDALPTAVPMPDPYLERVSAWWRLCAQTTGDPAPVEDADEALFRAAHQPWPFESAPAAGTITCGDGDADRLLLALAQGGQPARTELSAMASRFARNGVPQLPGAGGQYLGQCLAAVLDAGQHGGWPYRSTLIWDEGQRRQTLTALDDAVQREPAFAGVATLARIGPAVMAGDAAALNNALTTLQQTSPWLARVGISFSLNASRMHRKEPWLIATLQAAPATLVTAALRAKLDYLVRHPYTNLDDLLSAHGPDILARLPDTWRHHTAWQRQLALGRKIGAKLNDLTWGVATDPACLDADSAVPLARQQALAHGFDGTPHWQSDTIAAAFARAARPADAVFWQQAALTQLRSAGMKEEERQKALTAYTTRLANLRAGEMITEGDGAPVEAPPMADSLGMSSGRLLDGRRTGPWTTVTPTGTVVQISGYRAGELAGRHLLRTAGGALRWSGWIYKQARIGWWQIATADGGVACGWYDGETEGARCGWWTIRDAEGRIRAEGLCEEGRQVGSWRTFAANGELTTSDDFPPALPPDPLLPGATPPAAVDF